MSLALVANNPFDSNEVRRGRKRKYNYTELVQALADGKSIAEAAASVEMPVYTAQDIITRIRRQYRLSNAAHIVAHFLRNGWID